MRFQIKLSLSALAIVAALGTCAGRAAALMPGEVLVVANASSEGSEALGQYYCKARQILPERLLVLKTDISPDVTREDYNVQIRQPIRDWLARNDPDRKIKCIVLMWGMPVRVLGTRMTETQKLTREVYKVCQERMLGRMRANAQLMSTVNADFPAPRTQGLTPVGALFEPRAGADATVSTDANGLITYLDTEFKYRWPSAEKLTDPSRRRTALRQLAALQLDVYGSKGLLAKLPAAPAEGFPSRQQLEEEVKAAQEKLDAFLTPQQEPEPARRALEAASALLGAIGTHKYCQDQIVALDTTPEEASVDSELAILWDESGNLRSWRTNPMLWRLALEKQKPDDLPERMIMTARIDGPRPKDALRIIKDSIEVEKNGLHGVFYIDAGGKYPPYDEHLKRLAELVKRKSKMSVTLDTSPNVFPPDSCPNAALYVGWYSLQKYIPAFSWTRGSVGWHIASFEAQHLRAPASQEWCVKMIQNGIAATVGAVCEPLLDAFPRPEEFFPLLMTGHFTVAECYWRTVPHTSWRLTLIADPLYNPFALAPQISIVDLPEELAPRPEIKLTPATTTVPAPDLK